MELWFTAGKTFAMLCVVLGLLLAFLYALKRLTQKTSLNHEQIKLITSFSIGPRKQLLLVDVMDERLVLGVTSEHINCLAHYPLHKTQKFSSNSEGDIVVKDHLTSADKNTFSGHLNNNENHTLFQVPSEK